MAVRTVLLLPHAHQVLQDSDAFLHRLQLSGRGGTALLHRLQLLHHERRQRVDVGRGQRPAGVLEHGEQQLVAPGLDLQQNRKGQKPAPSEVRGQAGRAGSHRGVGGGQGAAVTLHAALLQDGHAHQLAAGRQQEQGDGGQHADVVHVWSGLVWKKQQRESLTVY